MNTSRAVNIEDLRQAGPRRPTRPRFGQTDGGADREHTLLRNSRAYDEIIFRPRCAVAAPNYDMRTTVLGTEISMPIILAPVGSSRMFYPRGEEVAARVAGSFGTIYTLSTLSGCLLEDVKKAPPAPAWYQLYLVGGHDVAREAIARARKAGYSAIVVTIDTPVAGMRERDLRNGMKELVTRNPLKMLPFIWQFAARPRWLSGFFRDGGMMSFPNVVLPGEGPMPY